MSTNNQPTARTSFLAHRLPGRANTSHLGKGLCSTRDSQRTEEWIDTLPYSNGQRVNDATQEKHCMPASVCCKWRASRGHADQTTPPASRRVPAQQALSTVRASPTDGTARSVTTASSRQSCPSACSRRDESTTLSLWAWQLVYFVDLMLLAKSLRCSADQSFAAWLDLGWASA